MAVTVAVSAVAVTVAVSAVAIMAIAVVTITVTVTPVIIATIVAVVAVVTIVIIMTVVAIMTVVIIVTVVAVVAVVIIGIRGVLRDHGTCVAVIGDIYHNAFLDRLHIHLIAARAYINVGIALLLKGIESSLLKSAGVGLRTEAKNQCCRRHKNAFHGVVLFSIAFNKSRLLS